MTDFYTNVLTTGNSILIRGVENGERFQRKEEFSPTLYINSNKSDTEWSTLQGDKVEEIKPGTINETREFVKLYETVEKFNIYGNTNYVRQYISDTYPKEILFDSSNIKTYSIDIETETEYGFPNVALANEKIQLITLMDATSKQITTFGLHDWKNNRADVNYIRCNNEANLLKEFLIFWSYNFPDVITGWNINMFDIPYLVNRITNVLGEDAVKKLSPWNKVKEKAIYINGKQHPAYTINGVAILDYLDLYKKFTYHTQESYKLDHIAFVELDERKLENPGETFKEFYQDYPDLFVEYNIQDTVLVDRLEDKMKLLELAITIAYMAKVNYDDVFSPVGLWDTIIYNHLREQNIVIPQQTYSTSTDHIEGAYVKEPIPGFYKNVASFDLASLYPHLIMNYNISPETMNTMRIPCNVESLLNQECDTSTLKDLNYSLTANGWSYRKDKKGFLPELMESMYNERSFNKKKMLKLEQEYENNKTTELSKEISRLDNLQMALKILLNSLYGALANKHFRYYDLRMAEGITLSGQLSIRWVSNRLNAYMNKALKTENVIYDIYQDTDSCYLTLEKIVEVACPNKSVEDTIKFMDKFCSEVLQPVISKSFDELALYMNAYEQKMSMKREILADKGIFIAKKRYILNVHNSEGVQYAEPKLKVMGLEMVRSSTPAVIRKKLKESIGVILEGDERKLQKFVADYRTEFNTLSVEAIAKPSGINGMTVYSGSPIYSKGAPIHVRGSLIFNHHIKRLNLDKKYPIIQDSDKIKFVYVQMPNPFHEDIISFSTELPKEFDLHRYIDYNKQFDKVFLNAITIIINPIGWSLEETSTLDEFF
jgi:DNA polymerase elongation subunit (family B)